MWKMIQATTASAMTRRGPKYSARTPEAKAAIAAMSPYTVKIVPT